MPQHRYKFINPKTGHTLWYRPVVARSAGEAITALAKIWPHEGIHHQHRDGRLTPVEADQPTPAVVTAIPPAGLAGADYCPVCHSSRVFEIATGEMSCNNGHIWDRSDFDEAIEAAISDISEDLKGEIANMLRKGMSAVAVAAALSVSPMLVQDVEARMPTHHAVRALSVEDILARTIYAEAEGESYAGKMAVASTIWNRAQGKWWMLKYVATQRKQYSCWNGGTPSVGTGQAWNDSVAIAKKMLSGEFRPTTRATHYYNPRKANPKWARTVASVSRERIGNHVFMQVESEEDA